MKARTRERLALYGLGYDNPKQEPIDRTKLGPQVTAYLECALETVETDPFFGTHTIDDIHEPSLRQMIRDNVHFYWRNRHTLERLYSEDGYTQRQCGADFWNARNREPSFALRGWDNAWDALNASAVGFGTVTLQQINHQIQMIFKEDMI